MRTIPPWRRYLTFWRSPIVQDVHDELHFHMTMRIREFMARGMSEEEARRAAAARLGDVGAAKSECVELGHTRERNARNAAFFDALRTDLRYAIRSLRARPGFAAAVIITLGLGLGANAAVFSVVDRLLFRTPPLLRDASRTHRLYVSYPTPNHDGAFMMDAVPYVRFANLSTTNRSFARSAAYAASRFFVGAPDEGRDRQIAGVTPGFFAFFNAPPALGRYFNEHEDMRPSGEPVVVLTYAMWQAEYGGRDDALGATIRIGQTMYTVIGIAPRGFVGLWPDAPPAAFVPFSSYASSFDYPERAGYSWWTSYDFGPPTGILLTRNPDASVEQAGAELTRSIGARWSDQSESGPPDLKPTAIIASTLAERGPEQTSAAKVAALVAAMALVVLLIAGANVANLLLARALRRRREIAVRLALGVSRRRLVQLLTETVLLALLGGFTGLVAARWAGPALRASFLSPSVDTAVVTDVRTLIFVGVAVIVAGVLTGFAPAWQAGQLDVTRHLRIGVREGTLQRSRARATLLVAQGALSVLLLVAAGLFVRSLSNARHVRLGYDVDPVLVVKLNMRDVHLDSARSTDLWSRLATAARSTPGVERVTLTGALPFVQDISANLRRPPDLATTRFSKLPDIHENVVTPDYFATMKTRLVRGRGIDATDLRGTTRAVVVSSRLAETFWRGRDAIGQCLPLWDVKPHTHRPRSATCAYVVGIAENVRDVSLGDDPGLYLYLACAQTPVQRPLLAIRTDGEGAQRVDAVRAMLQREMPGASYVTGTPYADVIGEQMRSWQLGATMFVAFGALAMVIAAVGLYSTISYNVIQRTHEVGVRRALGAQESDVVLLVVKQGLLLGGGGVVIGGVIAFAAADRVQSLLFEVSPHDPYVYGSVIVTMLIVALAASFIPARRAAMIDPNIALRSE